ncbi:MFS transporter [Raoultibacter phocaeensis]|uniref:MFS transporter n=1 Tax=Raoultibacter phocaeensis TaxID=2479841 RepID=UPI00111B49B7|nr:MFS transporter [Raoultibacter phocaeensis]
MPGKSTTIRFLVASSLSLLGNSVAGIALPLILLATTGDPLAAGTLALLCAVPQVLAGVLGGALLDRLNRRNVSVFSDIVSALCVAALPIVDMTVGLGFGWFVLFGVLGAVGDIPGMTARDSMLPTVVERDGASLQRFLGITQSLDSIVTIVGPALAALLMGVVGAVPCLWVTAGLSLAASVATATLPRSVGAVRGNAAADAESNRNANEVKIAAGESGNAHPERGNTAKGHTASISSAGSLAKAAWSSALDGARVLFKGDSILRTATLLTFGIVMVMGSYQGLVLPVFFTEAHRPELLGYTLSSMSAGLLIGSLAYAALMSMVSRRAWYTLSLCGMAVSIIVMGSLPSFSVMLLGAFALGLTAGPASALLGYFMFDRIPENRRGSALGTQNSLLLVAAPVALFATSVLVAGIGLQTASWVLVVAWLAITAGALFAKSMRGIDGEEVGSGVALTKGGGSDVASQVRAGGSNVATLARASSADAALTKGGGSNAASAAKEAR